jgi:hypothetical protein
MIYVRLFSECSKMPCCYLRRTTRIRCKTEPAWASRFWRNKATLEVLRGPSVRGCRVAMLSHISRPLPTRARGDAELCRDPPRQFVNLAASAGMVRMNSLFRRMNSLFRKKDSLFRKEQGISPQAVQIAVRFRAGQRQNGPKQAEFCKIPCYFPCCQGMRGSRSPRRSFDMIQILATPQEKHPLDPSHPYRWRRHRRHGGGAGAP